LWGVKVGAKIPRAYTFAVLLLVVPPAVLIPGLARAQVCELPPPPSATTIDAASVTGFLPSGGTGQILVRSLPPATVRIFEVDSVDLSKAKRLEVPVTLVKQLTEKTYEGRGFLTTDSSLVHFIVPDRGISFWEFRNFAVRVCGQGEKVNALAIVRARVSSPALTRAISLAALALLYAGFAYAMYKRQSAERPLAAKWPAYESARKRRWFEYLDPVVLTAGVFNQGSIQKLQVLLFSLLVAGMLLSLVLTLGVLSEFSSTVALLLGISAVGAAIGTKTTTSNERLQFENWAWLVRKRLLPINKEDQPKWSDLVMTGREFDVYKLQTLIFSLVVAVALLATGEDRLGSFTVPEMLLGILGLSQVVYVAGALVRAPSAADLDTALTELRGLETKLRTAISSNTDTDEAGHLLPAPSPPPTDLANVGKNARKQYDAKANQVEIMLESTLEIQVDRSKLAPDLA
jgi:hypothetical protein